LLACLLLVLILAGCQGAAGSQVVWQTVEVPVTIIAVQTVQVPMTILIPYTVEVPVTVEGPVTVQVLTTVGLPVPIETPSAGAAALALPPPTPKSLPATPSAPVALATPTAPPPVLEPDPYYTLARAQNIALFDVLSMLAGVMSGFRDDPSYLPPYANIVVQQSRVDVVRTTLSSASVLPELQQAHDLMIQACDRVDWAVGFLFDGKRTEYLDRAYELNVAAEKVLDTYYSE